MSVLSPNKYQILFLLPLPLSPQSHNLLSSNTPPHQSSPSSPPPLFDNPIPAVPHPYINYSLVHLLYGSNFPLIIIIINLVTVVQEREEEDCYVYTSGKECEIGTTAGSGCDGGEVLLDVWEGNL